MPRTRKPFDVDALWSLARLGEPSLSPDGAQAVASVTRHDMEQNKGQSSLYLFSTLGGEPRRLTEAGDKDGAPQWSPTGERVAFIARREQGGAKDEEAQLYLIAADGGEAQRAATVATGVECFKWFPDGRRIALVSWVWPGLKGARAQAAALKEFKARKESAYVTDELLYRHWDHHIPMGRVPHLHVLDLASGRLQDLMEGTDHSLDWKEPAAHSFDISPDGRLVFSAGITTRPFGVLLDEPGFLDSLWLADGGATPDTAATPPAGQVANSQAADKTTIDVEAKQKS